MVTNSPFKDHVDFLMKKVRIPPFGLYQDLYLYKGLYMSLPMVYKGSLILAFVFFNMEGHNHFAVLDV